MAPGNTGFPVPERGIILQKAKTACGEEAECF